MLIQFELSPVQRATYLAWRHEVDIPQENTADPPKHGTIGGAMTFCLTKTSIGTIVKAVYLMGTDEEQSLDLTDYDSW